jgi:hypothetical protein
MSDLPNRLSQGDTRVTFRARQGDARTELREAVDRKYVHVLFTETRSGTELGFSLDEEQSDLTRADWERGEGTIRLVGNLKLDGVPVRCVAEIDLASVEGVGRLEVLGAGATASPAPQGLHRPGPGGGSIRSSGVNTIRLRRPWPVPHVASELHASLCRTRAAPTPGQSVGGFTDRAFFRARRTGSGKDPYRTTVDRNSLLWRQSARA